MEGGELMADLFDSASSWLSLLPRISRTNLLEIVIIAFLVYEILFWIKNTRAWTLLRGILVILAFAMFAAVFNLDTILWILEKTTTIAVTALVIIFQPELRKALEQLGSRNILTGFLTFEDNKRQIEFSERHLSEITKAVFEMAKEKTGALIVIERMESLKEIERTGIDVDGLVSSQLLINIFEHNTPLHDGAVIIRGNRITSATCYLPLSDNMRISKELGTRHRAALGISEGSDSITIVVSEETGRVSVAQEGRLRKMADIEMLRDTLSVLIEEEVVTNRFRIWKGRRRHERKAD